MPDESQTTLKIVQIGDPVLRQTARELQKEEILISKVAIPRRYPLEHKR